MSNRNRARAVALVVVAVVSISACGLSDNVTQVTSTAKEVVDQGGSQPLESGDGVPAYTKPGASLPAGSSIVIPLWDPSIDPDYPSVIDDYGDHTLSMKVTGVRSGSAEDLAGEFDQGELGKIADYDIYYIDYTSRQEIKSYGLGDLRGYDPVGPPILDAADASGKTVTGNFVFYDGGPVACRLPILLDLVQAHLAHGCAIALVDKGSKIDHFVYTGFELADNTSGTSDPYRTKPLIIEGPVPVE